VLAILPSLTDAGVAEIEELTDRGVRFWDLRSQSRAIGSAMEGGF
jgi:hypothetical protein